MLLASFGMSRHPCRPAYPSLATLDVVVSLAVPPGHGLLWALDAQTGPLVQYLVLPLPRYMFHD